MKNFKNIFGQKNGLLRFLRLDGRINGNLCEKAFFVCRWGFCSEKREKSLDKAKKLCYHNTRNDRYRMETDSPQNKFTANNQGCWMDPAETTIDIGKPF